MYSGNRHRTLFGRRAEVEILTRNILPRGSDNMEWNNKTPACPDGFDPAIILAVIIGLV